MHSIMFVASMGADDFDDRQKWSNFLAFAGRLRQFENVYRLAENVWLVDMRLSPTPLGYLVTHANENQVSYGLLPFERAPEWLPAGFDPNSIGVRNG